MKSSKALLPLIAIAASCLTGAGTAQACVVTGGDGTKISVNKGRAMDLLGSSHFEMSVDGDAEMERPRADHEKGIAYWNIWQTGAVIPQIVGTIELERRQSGVVWVRDQLPLEVIVKSGNRLVVKSTGFEIATADRNCGSAEMILGGLEILARLRKL